MRYQVWIPAHESEADARITEDTDPRGAAESIADRDDDGVMEWPVTYRVRDASGWTADVDVRRAMEPVYRANNEMRPVDVKARS